MPLISHVYLILITSFESTWFINDFNTIYGRFYLVIFSLFECKFVWFVSRTECMDQQQLQT